MEERTRKREREREKSLSDIVFMKRDAFEREREREREGGVKSIFSVLSLMWSNYVFIKLHIRLKKTHNLLLKQSLVTKGRSVWYTFGT